MAEQQQPTMRDVNGADPRGYERFGGVIAPRSSQSQPWWPQRRTPQQDAPNVVVILIDDMGFSDIQPFGSEIPTPAIQALADDGYRLSNFRVTPLCAPSRAALLTGVNPHRAGFGMVPHIDPGYPGVSMVLPEGMPTLAESFRANGYATFMVGKWHLTREAEMHDAADKNTWPLQKGFDRYFGSMDGYTTLYHPHRIVRDNSPVTEQFDDDDYLTDRLTDEALAMIDTHHTGGDRHPFFLYFAHHAVHGPVQAKLDKIQANSGRYAAGWDRVRAERFQRQLESGLMPEGTELSPSGPDQTDGVPAWADLTDEQRELFARHMEVYAAAVSSIDESVARLVARLKEMGEYDNTIFVFTSDNGGTGEGGVEGTRSYFSQFVHLPGIPADWVRDVPRPLEDLGGPRVHGHYPRGWAHASNTPFRLYKGSVLEGGVHSPLIVSWPEGLARGEHDSGVRPQFAYVTDIAPTLMELCGITRPEKIGGVDTLPIDGESFAATLRESDAAPRRGGQQITHMGQRAFYRGRYKALARPPVRDLSAWELYDIEDDPTETRDIAGVNPELVAELAEEWRRAAWHNTVFPLPDEPTFTAQRPSTDLYLSQPVTLYPGRPTLERFRSSRLTEMRSVAIEADLSGALGDGVLLSHGDQGGGYLLYAEDGRLCLSYNAYGDMHRRDAPVEGPVERITVQLDALPDFAWRVSVAVDGADVITLERVPMLVGGAPFTGISIGFDGGGPVDWDLHERRGAFSHSGSLQRVRYLPGEKAPYNNEIIVAIDDLSARLLD